MGKRGADKQITDRDVEGETASAEDGEGMFAAASQEKLSGRKIVKAKRRNRGGDSAAASPFGGGAVGSPFAALGGAKSSPFASASSSFGNKAPESVKFGKATTDNPFAALDQGTGSSGNRKDSKVNGSSPSSFGANSFTASASPKKASESLTSSSSRDDSIIALNASFKEYINKHVNSHPCCDLTPGMQDYIKHMTSLKKEDGVGSSARLSYSDTKKTPFPVSGNGDDSGNKNAPAFSFGVGSGANKKSDSEPPKATFAFGASSSSSDKKEASSAFAFGSDKASSPAKDGEKKSPFAFGAAKTSPDGKGKTVGASTFSFGGSLGAKSGEPEAKKEGGSGFSFGSSLGSSSSPFGTVAKATEKKDDEEEEGIVDSEPSKNVAAEAAPGEEDTEDTLHSVRCKLYVMKDGSYVDLGVGVMKINEFKDSKKRRLIMRTETVGKVILNVMLFPGLTIKKEAKNTSASFICVGTDQKPMKYLIRVKNPGDIEALIAKVDELKK
eukprot:Nk52_evm46s226 gene=Nk52_evmTU46s226